MKKRHFDVESDGFYGAYWKCKTGSDCAMIAMIGDDPEDYLARTSVKWLHKLGVNVMTMSPAKKDYGHHNYPLERIEKAISWLKIHGNQKIGIVGASTTGTLALTAASYFKDITLTIGLTPSDFIWQGFMQGKRDGCKEWPMEGESLFSYKEEPLPYMPFCYKHPDYWHVIEKETKRTGDMINSRKLFDDSEKAHPITEDALQTGSRFRKGSGLSRSREVCQNRCCSSLRWQRPGYPSTGQRTDGADSHAAQNTRP